MKKNIDTPGGQIPKSNSKSDKMPTKEQLEKLNNKLKKVLGKDLRKLENIVKKKVGDKSYRENMEFLPEFLEERVGKNNKTIRINTANDFEELDLRYKRFSAIKKKAEERFDKLISFTGVEKESFKQYDFVPRNDGIIVMKENNKYERSKEIFVNIIRNHFRTNKIIIGEISEGLPLAGQLKEARVTNDITEITDDMIDKVIDRYVDVVVLILGLAIPLTTKLKKEIGQMFSKYKKEIEHLAREKDLLHDQLDKENADDKRKLKKKCEDYIKEVLLKGDKNLTKTKLAKIIKKRIQTKYPQKRFSDYTIRPMLSSLDIP